MEIRTRRAVVLHVPDEYDRLASAFTCSRRSGTHAYAINGTYIGFSALHPAGRKIWWDSFYPLDEFHDFQLCELKGRGIGALAHEQTLLLLAASFPLDTRIGHERDTLSDKRRAQLRRMRIRNGNTLEHWIARTREYMERHTQPI